MPSSFADQGSRLRAVLCGATANNDARALLPKQPRDPSHTLSRGPHRTGYVVSAPRPAQGCASRRPSDDDLAARQPNEVVVASPLVFSRPARAARADSGPGSPPARTRPAFNDRLPDNDHAGVVVTDSALEERRSSSAPLRQWFVADSPLEGTGFEPSVPP
jgi:hypothetical protein